MSEDFDIDINPNEIEDGYLVDTDKIDDDIPEFGSSEWHYYVMSFLEEDEVHDVNGVMCPSCDGLRRIVEILVGPIISTVVKDSVPPDNNNGQTATVVASVIINVRNMNHPLNGMDIVGEDIVDVGPNNAKDPFCNHPSATAFTKAEGRVYKKFLRLRNVQTVEEAKESSTVVVEDPDRDITVGQISVIDRICSRINVDVNEFINCGRTKHNNISDVKWSTAAKMIQLLNKIQREDVPKPELSPYNKEWNANE